MVKTKDQTRSTKQQQKKIPRSTLVAACAPHTGTSIRRLPSSVLRGRACTGLGGKQVEFVCSVSAVYLECICSVSRVSGAGLTANAHALAWIREERRRGGDAGGRG